MTLRLCNLHFVLASVLLAACASAPAGGPGATFVVVRHAEKASDGSKDPPLSGAGEARAQTLARSLDEAPLRAAYATSYRRTQQTAAPAARAHGLPVVTYDAALPAEVFAGQLRRAHGVGTVLVVGHSNTAASIAAALCGCTIAPLADDEYDRRFAIRIDAGGQATLREERY